MAVWARWSQGLGVGVCRASADGLSRVPVHPAGGTRPLMT